MLLYIPNKTERLVYLKYNSLFTYSFSSVSKTAFLFLFFLKNSPNAKPQAATAKMININTIYDKNVFIKAIINLTNPSKVLYVRILRPLHIIATKDLIRQGCFPNTRLRKFPNSLFQKTIGLNSCLFNNFRLISHDFQ